MTLITPIPHKKITDIGKDTREYQWNGVEDDSLFFLGISGEPPFFNSVFLLYKFVYRPEAGERHNARYGSPNKAMDEERPNAKTYSAQRKHPPTSFTKEVLRFNDNGVKKSYNQESRKTNYDSYIIHNQYTFNSTTTILRALLREPHPNHSPRH